MTAGTGAAAYDPERLALQAAIVAAAEDRALAAVGFPDSGRVLDVGCGNGAVLARLAALHPGLHLDGIELRADLAAAARRHVHPGVGEIIEGDAASDALWSRLESRYDAALARLVVRQAAGAEALVRGMARAVRPGGRVVLVDADDVVLTTRPEVPGLALALEETYRVVRARGADPRAGNRLPELARQAGLVDLAVSVVPLTTATVGGAAGRAAFRALLSFLWLDPESRQVIPARAALAEAFEAWCALDDAYGAWSLIALGGTRPAG